MADAPDVSTPTSPYDRDVLRSQMETLRREAAVRAKLETEIVAEHDETRAATEKSAKEKLAATTPAATLAPVVGHTTAAAIFAEVGDARSFNCTRAFLKAMGLNLKEKSSGTVHGQIKITKRGPSRVRQLLWLAVFRWIQKDPIANAWYQRKKQRDGGRASRAAVALMRKMAKALYHVGRGGTFDSSKLFDTRRLNVAA